MHYPGSSQGVPESCLGSLPVRAGHVDDGQHLLAEELRPVVVVGEPFDEYLHQPADIVYTDGRRQDDAIRPQDGSYDRRTVVTQRAFVFAPGHAGIAAGAQPEVRILHGRREARAVRSILLR